MEWFGPACAAVGEYFVWQIVQLRAWCCGGCCCYRVGCALAAWCHTIHKLSHLWWSSNVKSTARHWRSINQRNLTTSASANSDQVESVISSIFSFPVESRTVQIVHLIHDGSAYILRCVAGDNHMWKCSCIIAWNLRCLPNGSWHIQFTSAREALRYIDLNNPVGSSPWLRGWY